MSKKYDFSEREWFVICTALFGLDVTLSKDNDVEGEIELWVIIWKVLAYLSEEDRAFVEREISEAQAEK